MSITVGNLRNAARLGAVHVDANNIANATLDYHIVAAARRFCRETCCARETTSHTLASGGVSFDPTSATATFEIDQFIEADISLAKVEKIDWDSMRERHTAAGGIVPVGQPARLAFRTKSSCYVDKKADQQYNVTILRRQPFTSITIGSESDSTTTNLPDDWGFDVAFHGVMYYMLRGLPGHPEYQAALNDWIALLAEARAAFASPLPPIEDFNTAGRGNNGPPAPPVRKA